MGQKRFTMYQNILYDDGYVINAFECMKLLNFFDRKNGELLDENNQLKTELSAKDIQLDFLQSENFHMKTVLNENKELKQTINNLTTGENYLQRKEKVIELQKENEQLKSEVDDFQDLLFEMIDDKIAFLYGVKGDLINEDSYRLGQISFAINVLSELRHELKSGEKND